MSFEIGVLHKSRPHLLADLAELLLVVQYDNLEQLSQAKLELIAKEMPLSADDDELDDDDNNPEPHAIDKHDAVDRFIEDCWQQLEYRQAVFGEFYPFKIEGTQLKWREGPRTERQCVYAFLLICSRLRSFKIKGYPQGAARAFTRICREALEAVSGRTASVRVFDWNSDDRRNHFGSDLRKAMKKLAGDLGAHFINEVEINKLSSSGDYGLDLVSTHHFSDGACGSYNIFGQCGAQEREWPSKTLEAHPIKFQGLFTLLNQPDNLMFIPISFRDANGSWVAGHRTSGCLLIDRLRILQLIDPYWDESHARFTDAYLPLLETAVRT